MAFDAGLLAHIIKEINDKLSGGRVEKIYQPARDEFVFIIRSFNESHRLLINAGSRCPRIGITEIKSENPAKAPMLCMFLRKYLHGAVFSVAEQIGFERAAILRSSRSSVLPRPSTPLPPPPSLALTITG